MSFSIKQHDTRPVYLVSLRDQYNTVNETALDLTNATSILFKMRTHGSTGVPKVSAAATIVNAALGQVQYTFLAADTDTVGQYDAEFEITWSDGGVETVPNDSYLTIQVVDDLDSP